MRYDRVHSSKRNIWPLTTRETFSKGEGKKAPPALQFVDSTSNFMPILVLFIESGVIWIP